MVTLPADLLHVRPVLDLHDANDLKKFRQVADQTSALVRQFKGSLSAEHGVGIARTEYMREQLGDELLGVMRQIKRMFDPRNIFNPGKIFDCSHGAASPCTGSREESLDTARLLQSRRSTIICAKTSGERGAPIRARARLRI